MKSSISIFAAASIGILLVASLKDLDPSTGTYSSLNNDKTRPENITKENIIKEKPKGCVFKTIFGEEPSDSQAVFKTSASVMTSLDQALAWMAKAQQSNGGWGCGSHHLQHEMDPHAVTADPATTAMVCMGILRSGSDLQKGKYTTHLNKGLNYLLECVEKSNPNSSNITELTSTQIQTKLGANIDVIMTSQFFSNILDYVEHDATLKKRIQKCQDVCIVKIQSTQIADGSFSGGSWAGVLQSSLANNALESAYDKGAKVDTIVIRKSRDYQQGNYNANTGEVNTERGAGVVLYAVSSSNRAAAPEVREIQGAVQKAKKEGRLDQEDEITVEVLEKIGYSKDQAMHFSTTYQVYQASKQQAQDERVIQGYGNNGGEEFLSYLQTGESLIIANDNEWLKWYNNTSGRLISIQNNDGSWNGHHCITSPVFCTATCVLILSVNNDFEKLSGKN